MSDVLVTFLMGLKNTDVMGMCWCSTGCRHSTLTITGKDNKFFK